MTLLWIAAASAGAACLAMIVSRLMRSPRPRRIFRPRRLPRPAYPH